MLLSKNLPPAIWTSYSLSVLALPTQNASALDKYSLSQHVVPLHPPENLVVASFDADVIVGNHCLRATLDTGSSNSWFLTDGVQCFPSPPGVCSYNGPKYHPDASFQTIANEHTNLSYGNGDAIIGSVGICDFTFGGVKVCQQEFSLAKYMAVGYATNVTSGLLGLGYPANTGTYPGQPSLNLSSDVGCSPDINNGTNVICNRQIYPPILSAMFERHLTEPVFAFAMSRSNTSGGVMTLGGIPDTNDPKINATHGPVATVAIEKLLGEKDHRYYSGSISGLFYHGAAVGAGAAQYIFDTGTVVNTLGKEQADAINALFDPPAVYNETIRNYIVQCNATAPTFGVQIGGEIFSMNSREMVLDTTGFSMYPAGECVSAIQRSVSVSDYPPILGSTFLRSVLAVFDVGRSEMTFSSRVYYEE